MAQLGHAIKLICCLSLLFFTNPDIQAQNPSASPEHGAPGSDALPFLTELFARYAHAASYRLEYTEERTLDSEFNRSWTKAIVTSVVGPANHYRFERRDSVGGAVQVSDGETEWNYDESLKQYTQRPTPSSGPTSFLPVTSRVLHILTQVQSHLKTLSREWSSIPTAKFAPDEEIEVGGKKMTCVVIKADYEIPEDVKHPDAGFRNVKTNFTFWIDKESGLIRRSIQRADGVLKDRPGIRFSSSTERSYEIAELNNSDFSLSTFKFTPPVSAILVKEFESNEAQALAKLIGKPMGSLILRPAADKGEPVTLQAFAGQPVLLDFWATWCQPCRDSLPALERLYADYQAKGLVVVSLDEDEDAPRAIEFWTANKVPWSNFHASKEILDNFPTHGIPYFVLLDSSGKVTFSSAGLDESSLRNAIAVQVGSASR